MHHIDITKYFPHCCPVKDSLFNNNDLYNVRQYNVRVNYNKLSLVAGDYEDIDYTVNYSS